MILPAYKAALGGQLKNRPGPARASASFSPGFHPGSSHTRDALINQYEISNHKSEIPFLALEFTLDVSSLAFEFTLGVCLLACLPGVGGHPD